MFLPLAITAFGRPEGYFSRAIIAFGAFGVHCPQILLALRKNGQEESRLLNLTRLRSSRNLLMERGSQHKGAVREPATCMGTKYRGFFMRGSQTS